MLDSARVAAKTTPHGQFCVYERRTHGGSICRVFITLADTAHCAQCRLQYFQSQSQGSIVLLVQSWRHLRVPPSNRASIGKRCRRRSDCVKLNLSQFLTTNTTPQDFSSLRLAPRNLPYWRLADAETAPLLRYYGKPTSPRTGYEMPRIPRMWSPEAKHQVLRSPGVRWSMRCKRALLIFAERRTLSLDSQKKQHKPSSSAYWTSIAYTGTPNIGSDPLLHSSPVAAIVHEPQPPSRNPDA